MIDKLNTNARAYLALGANLAGAWGPPTATFARAVTSLEDAGVVIVKKSSLYRTRAVGPGVQLPYLNAVVEVRTPMAAPQLLRALKKIERQAGRRFGRIWGPRALDLDLLDFGGALMGNLPRGHRRGLVLPHPELHRRAFVLAPLAEIAPAWRHPRLKRSAKSLLQHLPLPLRRGVGDRLAFTGSACEKTA